MLYKRHHTYYFRILIPPPLRHIFGGKSEIKRSLKTKDRHLAQLAASELSQRYMALMLLANLGMITETQAIKMRALIIGESIEDLHGEIDFFSNLDVPLYEYGARLGQHSWTANEIVDALTLKSSDAGPEPGFIKSMREQALKVEEDLHKNLIHPYVRTRAKNLVRKLNLDVIPPPLDYSADEPTPIVDNNIPRDFVDVCTIITKTAVDVILNEYNKGRGTGRTAERIVGQYKDGTNPKLSDLWDAYKKNKESKNDWRSTTAQKYVDGFSVVIDIMGDVDVCNCNSQFAEDLIAKIQCYPKNKNKLAQFKDVPFDIKMSTMPGFQKFSTEHINFHIGMMSGLFKYALLDPKRWKVDMNPFLRQQVNDSQTDQPKEKRKSFKKEVIEEILTELSWVRRRVEPAKFWVVLICLYSGMRINEPCQMRVEDIKRIDGVWIFEICHKPWINQMTKNGKSRKVPIHRTLIELGFLDYVKEMQKQKKDRLFPQLKEYEGKYYHKIDKWFNITVLKAHLKKGKDYSFHSTKHTFINWFKQNVNLSDDNNMHMLKYLVAHLDDGKLTEKHNSGGITTEVYSEDYPARKLANFINKLDYNIDFNLLERQPTRRKILKEA